MACRRIFIRGLNPQTTLFDLREFLQVFGNVVNCYIVTKNNRTTNHAFATLSDPNAIALLLELGQLYLQGRMITFLPRYRQSLWNRNVVCRIKDYDRLSLPLVAQQGQSIPQIENGCRGCRWARIYDRSMYIAGVPPARLYNIVTTGHLNVFYHNGIGWIDSRRTHFEC